MSNSGTWLETLVSTIEKTVLPPGFIVRSREKIYNDDGVQIAEFDLIVEGRLGTTQIRWLIECRDRPADGAAESAWIEQLGGRREVHGFNKVTAVSTTGFSPGAVAAAQKLDIELRTITDLSVEAVLEWMKLSYITIWVRRGDLIFANLDIGDQPEELLAECNQILIEAALRDQILVHGETGKKVSILNTWQEAMAHYPKMFNDVMLDSDPKLQQLLVNYPNPESRYRIETTAGPKDILHITFLAHLTMREKQVMVSRILEYSNTEEGLIAQSVQFEAVELEDETVEFSINKVRDAIGGQTFFALKKFKKGDKNHGDE